MILLDTNAVVWLLAGHRRARPLLRGAQRLYVSPVTLLELRFLEEVGRLRFKHQGFRLEDDSRFALDDPSSAALFAAAADISWTRDPFDRLIAAHGLLRGWRIATGDAQMLEHLGAKRSIEL